jgi:hypothetical protein
MARTLDEYWETINDVKTRMTLVKSFLKSNL